MKLSNYDIVIINSSAGKDSLCALWYVCELAEKQGYPISRIIVSHQDLGRMEWPGTKELVHLQAERFGLQTVVSVRVNNNGDQEDLLEYVKKRGMWPSRNQRYCTSDYKRDQGGKVVRRLAKGTEKTKVLYVFGFRAEESPDRSKKKTFIKNKRFSTANRTVHDWLPIHKWSVKKVWTVIKENSLPFHPAYDLGMPRLSCVFCIFSPFDALVIAGIHNPKLLDEYIEVERAIKHTFQPTLKIESVRDAIQSGYKPKHVCNWVM